MGLVTIARACPSRTARVACSIPATIWPWPPRLAGVRTRRTGKARPKASRPVAKSPTLSMATASPSRAARSAMRSGSPRSTKGGSASGIRFSQLRSVMSGPMPAGSPIVTASGGCSAGAGAGPCLVAASSEFDVGILSDIAQVALGEHLEFLGPQVLLHLLALLFVGFHVAPTADGKQVDGTRHGTRRQHIAIPGAEQQGSRRFANAARFDEFHVVEFDARCLLGEARHALAAPELAPQRLGFREALGHLGLVGGGRQRQGNLLHMQLHAVLAAFTGGGHGTVDVALRHRDEGREAAANDLAPADHGPKPLL